MPANPCSSPADIRQGLMRDCTGGSPSLSWLSVTATEKDPRHFLSFYWRGLGAFG